ncbi:hypothetical protein FEM48_Zijuj06G0007000 [Ziziphus jujuba var. spinosa]|uniref:Glycosyltransferase family 92 protein n=1 Tax=Ziziphus jujuba var. spinosa TaxID=714518 RepID=A0A978V664_ZIZJJ|nr:hypothetical protein FEM48_Zijuj06G0007000 [Ziziphus jujuba var. spinosa]
MPRGVPTTIFFTFLLILFFAFFSLHLNRSALSGNADANANANADAFLYRPSSDHNLSARPTNKNSAFYNYAIHEQQQQQQQHSISRHVSSINFSLRSVSVLIPDWEILAIVSPGTPFSPLASGDDYVCVFQNNATSPARFSGKLPFTNRTTFKCLMPNSVRRLRPFFMPTLTKATENQPSISSASADAELYRWNFLVYESFSTDDDVVLFVKGVNQRQGINRSPSVFRCVFFHPSINNPVKTDVTSSSQEVFRCRHPKFNTTSVLSSATEIRMSLEMVEENRVVPSVAYYIPRSRSRSRSSEAVEMERPKPKSKLCACTMVFNVAKFLKEWVVYHSKIGVDKFILYDNASHDHLERVVEELNREGYDVTALFWIWPKTQEAGFSHSALYASESCTWMMYVDVDEFVFSPSWAAAAAVANSISDDHNLKSLLPGVPHPSSSSHDSPRRTGQVSISCNEFGPSNQRSHPIEGVTQGYTCRRKIEQRHKSIVLLDAVDPSLLNVIHHFKLKNGYESKQMSLENAVVNHYKYQAWPEFQTKFRRRVSAYVVDWKETVNPASKDRTPGLGFQPIEPEGWSHMFCEVRDERLKVLTRRWFGSHTLNGFKMVWQM